MSTAKDFCTKTFEVAKKLTSKTRESFVTAGNQIVDCLTPKRDYSYLPEEDADAMRKIDRAETVDNIFWFSFYIIYYMVIIVYCIKHAKDIESTESDK